MSVRVFLHIDTGVGLIGDAIQENQCQVVLSRSEGVSGKRLDLGK